MKREDKSLAIAELTDRLKEADAVFAVDYRGISVTQAADLRRKLSESDAVFKVVKNRLAKLAAAEAGTEGIDELLVGPTALTLIKGDAVIAAKTISTFARENEVLEFKGGLMDGEALDLDAFKVIASLPGLDVLRGQLVGVAASPITGLVRGLGAMLSGLAVALGQIAEQGLVSGEEQAEEPASEEPAAEAADAEPEADPDTPGREAEDVAGSDSDEAAAEEPTPEPDDAQPESDPADPGSEAEESADGDSEVSDEEESQPEEPAADDAEAEGSKE